MSLKDNNKIYLCVDFDGTLFDHIFPDIGKEVPHAFDTLKWLKSLGFIHLILYTMRDYDMGGGDYLTDALFEIKKRGFEFDSVNLNPNQYTWSSSKKIYGNWYIDDTSLGCPTININGFNRACVDWIKVKQMLQQKFIEKGFLE